MLIRRGRRWDGDHSRLNFYRIGTSPKESRGFLAEERGHAVLDLQHRAFTKSDHRTFVLLEVLANPFLARFAAMGRMRIDVEVVRIDLEVDEAEGGKRRRLDDRHVVRGLHRRCGDHRPRARSEVGETGANALADRVEEIAIVERLEQTERIAAADEN